MTRLFSTGEASSLLSVPFSRLNAAIRAGHAGPVCFAAGRRLLTPENIRRLGKHFRVSVPPEAYSDLDPKDLRQGQGK